ncbi:MAG: hypothetical protein AB201_00550 [Parcubacteria bacterium C7867-006]|nr:MAG: hypothetical protein AB201_00550 [Parcubacteria bacterium C7867-006]
MNKNILWVTLAVVVVVLIVWMASLSGEKDVINIETPDVTDQSTNTTGVKTTTGSKSVSTIKTQTFTNILPKVGNYQCDYEAVTPTTRTTNTIYLSDGKMRGEFRTTTANGSIANIMVYDGTYLYTWVEGQSVGTASQPKSLSDFPSIIPKDLVASQSLGSGLNNASWSCHPWSKVSSMLQKPSYLKI